MSTSESILFLLGAEMAAERPDDYLVQADPTPVVTDLRDSEPPPPPSSSTFDEPPPSSRMPASSRARGMHVPSVFDVVEFGVPSPRTASRLDHIYDHGADLGPRLRFTPPNPVGMREAISNIMVDDRDGPASNRIAVQERIQNRSRIRELADTLVRYKSVGVLNSAYAAPMHVRAAVLYRQANALCWEITEPFPEPPFVIEVAGFNSVFQMYIKAASMRDGLMLTPLPPEVVRLRRRWGRRTSAPEGYAIALRVDGDDRTRLCALRDVSFTGLSFWNHQEDQAIRPGTRITAAEIVTPDAPPIRITGEISFVARDAGGRGDLCGTRLEPVGDDDRAHWRELVSRRLHPTTRAGRGYYDAIWELYQQAGYFNLSGKDPAGFAKLRECFFRNAPRLDATPELGCVVVWPVEDQALATISMLKIYKGSWFVYQLAKLRGDAPDGTSSRQVLRDVHLRAYEHAQLDPDLAWVIAYPQVLDPPIWSHSVHYELPRRFTTAGLACVVRFRALEVSCSAPPANYEEPTPQFEIDRATPAELDTFFRWLREARPRPYVEAYDLTPDRIGLDQNKEFWGRVDMARDREIRVARHEGRMAAIAVLEDAEEGLHLFRLLDTIRPFPMTWDPALAAPAVDALVESAKAWYRSKGKAAFCAFVEDDTWVTPAMKATMEDMGQADTTILSAQLLPELLEHLIQVTAPRGDRGRDRE
ncbi:MAG: PilZ domain-containing protein [Minicystis sp.]